MKPAFQGIDVTYKSKADNKDIRDLLEKLVPQAAGQLKEFSTQFKSSSVESSCKKIFDYIKNNFRYIADKDEQIIKLPSALLKYKVGDCKSYSLFTAGILENLGIPYNFLYTSYNDNPIPHHVYVETVSGCKIDVVYGKFNQEKKAKFKYKKSMNVRYMAGLGSCGCNGNCGCSSCKNNRMGNVFSDKLKQLQRYGSEQQDAAKEALRKAEEEAKRLRDKAIAEAKVLQDKLKDLGQGATTISLAPGRALFMLMIENNLDGFASKLSTGNTTELLNSWYRLGGNRTKLAEALKKGASRPEKKFGFLAKLNKIYDKAAINGIGETSAEPSEASKQVNDAIAKYSISGDIKSLIFGLSTASGTAIGTAIGPPHGTAIGAGAGAALGTIIVGLTPVIVNAVRKTPKTENPEEPFKTPTGLDQDTIDNLNNNITTENKKNNTLLYVGGGALILGALYFGLKKK